MFVNTIRLCFPGKHLEPNPFSSKFPDIISIFSHLPQHNTSLTVDMVTTQSSRGTPPLRFKALLPRSSSRIFSCSSPFPRSPYVRQTLTGIQNSGVIACLRAPSAELALKAACAALDAGISVLEVVTSTPGVFEVVQQLVHEYPTSIIGVGTVLKVEDAKIAIKSGAKFLMSPATVLDILDYSKDADFLYVPGAMTPTEVLNAYNAGVHIVKVYPVSALGGIKYISAIKKPFAHIPLVASQGITLDAVASYIGCGASAVVLSDAVFNKETIHQGNWKSIYQVARYAALIGKEAVAGTKMHIKKSNSGS